jgi:hypothetical protein
MSSPNLSGPTPPAAASSIPPSVASLIPLLNLSGNQQNSTSVNSNAGSTGSSSVKGGSSASATGTASASAGSPGSAGSGASGGSNSSSDDEPRFSGLNDFVPQRSNTFEIALICEKRWVRVEPGGYRITPDRLKAGDRTLPTLLGRLLQKQRDSEPSKDWTPALRMLVERDGDSTYWSAMRQVYVSGLDWPITINLVGSYAPRIGDWELK